MFWVRSQNFFNFTLANTDLKMLKMTMVQNRNWGKKNCQINFTRDYSKIFKN